MDTKSLYKNKIKKDHFNQEEFSREKKVDINILLNRVKVEEKNLIRKNFIITAGALSTLVITGLIIFL